jgi:hypothetical protein
VVVDGVNPDSCISSLTSKKDPDILIVKDTNGKLSATKTDKTTGKYTEVNLISRGNAYGIINSDDLDNESSH